MMRARGTARTGLSLTNAPLAHREFQDPADQRRARHVAWGALLVSAAAIGGYFLGNLPAEPVAGVSNQPPGSPEINDRANRLVPPRVP